MTVLESIIEGVRSDLAAREAQISLAEIQNLAAHQAPALDVVPAIANSQNISLICEVKRKSPSKGDLAEIADPAALAEQYAAGGAAAISVLTEERRFNGSLADLDQVRQRVQIPVLRKDFMVSEYQIFEARAHGADLILLIVAALDDSQLTDLFDLTCALGMRALIETHSEAEIERALKLDAQLIGVNARNLKTLEVDRQIAENLVRTIPTDRLAVAESAVVDFTDVEAYAAAGADAALIGEALVRHATPQQAVQEFGAIPRSLRH